jgi:hypothetical protein
MPEPISAILALAMVLFSLFLGCWRTTRPNAALLYALILTALQRGTAGGASFFSEI